MMKVSICMLAYNSGKFIRQAIESVFSQQGNIEFELVIAEDCSTDNTKQIAEEYQLKYPGIIKLVANPVNLGLSANYVNALKNCSAKYIAMLDSDDYWSDPFKLQKQVDFLDKNKDYGVVYSDCKAIDDKGDEIEWSEMKYLRELFSSGYLFFKLLKETAFIPNLTACFRSELISDELKNENLWFLEDWWLWMRVSIKTKFYFMDHPTSYYRLHGGNITKTRIETKEKLRKYKRKAYNIYYSNILYFYHYNKQKLQPADRELLISRIMMLLYRPHGTFKMKLKLLPLCIKYFPGIRSFYHLLIRKARKKSSLSYNQE